jgi:tRNA(Ile)-lysidine synthase
MALAFLCSQLRQQNGDFLIADNRLQNFRAFVIDHMLREGSAEEASKVSKEVRKLGIVCEVHQASWTRELGPDVDLHNLSNLESAARRVRYRRLGRLCAYRRIATLLLAHHEDDQYETVLMRLMAGHRNRALRGMRKAAAIPECEGILGAYDSGWVDDQRHQRPYLHNTLSKRERKYLVHDLKLSINHLMDEGLSDSHELDNLPFVDDLPGMDDWSIGSMPVEDGGVSIYRPLLEFSKDRLIATCLENDVPWFEDHTNKDPTLTTRNSIRHMYRSCELPRALQKPRIISLSKECQRRAETQDAEAKRLLQRMALHNFEPHTGTMVVQFPKLSISKQSRYSRSPERYRRRRTRMRLMAALAIQRVIALVSPDLQAPPVANLQNVISRLFPALSEDDGRTNYAPKGFNIAGLHFMPVESTPRSVNRQSQFHQRTWYISRQPYPASMPLPQWRIPYWSVGKRSKRWARRDYWKWSTWLPWHFWDNRYWIRLTHRLPYRVVVMPFFIDHAKSFRESLSLQDRGRLASILKEIAPGKVRYTLPAIYSEEYLDLNNVVPRMGYPVPEDQYLAGGILPKREGPSNKPLAPVDPSKMRLLALPTLDIQIPELEKWLLYETRYKRADRSVLRAMAGYSKGSFGASGEFKPRKMSSKKSKRRSRRSFVKSARYK